jgi:integrase
MRVGEVRGLRLEDLDWAKELIYGGLGEYGRSRKQCGDHEASGYARVV